MIFGKKQNENLERLQNVLISDKQFNPKKLEGIVKSDAYNMLSNYCVLDADDLSVSVEFQKDGNYEFRIVAKSRRLKIFGSLPDVYWWCYIENLFTTLPIEQVRYTSNTKNKQKKWKCLQVYYTSFGRGLQGQRQKPIPSQSLSDWIIH